MSASSLMDSNSDHYGSALVLRRPQKGRMAALRDEPSKVSSQRMWMADARRLRVMRVSCFVQTVVASLPVSVSCLSSLTFSFRFSLLAFSLDFSGM